jgi:hypothetical protein
MAQIYIDPRLETQALWRAAVLLKRLRQDCGDAEINALEKGVSAIRRAAAGGKLVRRSLVAALERILRRTLLPPAGGRSTSDLIRRATLTETGELLGRLETLHAIRTH